MADNKNLDGLEGQVSDQIWKEKLKSQMPADWAKEIDEYETELFLKKQGKIEDKVFAESRLRRGAYGQRYDNGKRHDGKADRSVGFPDPQLTKGPMTLWHAPGMERIKLPWGGMTPEQMDVLADLAEEYSDAICHVTTRQDIQLHYVHIEDTPSMFRRLAAVGITTREACGNSVRNVTACPYAGICPDEQFDTTPYAEAAFRYLLGHPDVQDFGRKFKIAFSGCKESACALVRLHDLGFISVKRNENGKERLGFEMYVGGGLGAVPYQAKLFDEFIPVEEFLAYTQAISRIFARYGEKKNRNRARIKFLVHDWGIEKFKAEVMAEKAKLKPDARWTDLLKNPEQFDEKPLKAASAEAVSNDVEYTRWRSTNVSEQKQKGYFAVKIVLPLGDLTSNQMRDLADVVRKYVGQTIRTTVDQNVVLRWVTGQDLPEVHRALKAIHLADPHAGTIVDVTACPGTDTCKLGISASRGLAGVLREHLAVKSYQMEESVRNLLIKVSGCFNSCGQQHVADIGFYGISRKAGGYLVPHFQLVIGGQTRDNAGSYGMPVGGFPSKAIPQTVDRLTEMYLKGREKEETFQTYIKRLGKVELKKQLTDLMEVPAYDNDKSYYTDWGSVREFTTSDIGKGECAGEIVSLTEFGLKAADRENFESQVLLEKGDVKGAAQMAYRAMLTAAQGLIKGPNPDISDKPEEIIGEFRTRFYDTELFFDPFSGGRFAQYLFGAQKLDIASLDDEKTRKLIEESSLFIEAAYACNIRMSMTAPAAAH